MPRKGTSTSLSPTIPVEQVKACRFVLGGQTYQVLTCDVDVLRQLVRSALPEQQERLDKRLERRNFTALLALLDKEECDELTRWYVIEELVALKVNVQFAA